jgi:hypothetical protein
MAFFTDSGQLYACAKALFTQIEEEDPGASDAILASHLVIRLHCTEPDAEFTLNGRRRPVQFTYGPAKVRPTMDIELAADTLHRILLNELSLKKAMGNGLLKVRGPVWKVTVLADVFYRGRAIYPQILEDQGLNVGPDGQ